MFTGIVDSKGVVVHQQKSQYGSMLQIRCQHYTDIKLGESIAVDGACLTVSEILKQGFCCDVSSETLDKTIIASYQTGIVVNLERALRLNDRLGGHIVMGHVDQTVCLLQSQSKGKFIEMTFTGINNSAKDYLVDKGSVTINGVSLTVNEITSEDFSVMLVPQTQALTNLAELAIGDRVNIEYDWLMKTIVAQCRTRLASGNIMGLK